MARPTAVYRRRRAGGANGARASRSNKGSHGDRNQVVNNGEESYAQNWGTRESEKRGKVVGVASSAGRHARAADGTRTPARTPIWLAP